MNQEAIEFFEALKQDEYALTARDKEMFDVAINALKAEKTGHWKRISMDKYSEHAKYWYRCDRCGKDNLGNTDWCPNCGCRMVEPQESENT